LEKSKQYQEFINELEKLYNHAVKINKIWAKWQHFTDEEYGNLNRHYPVNLPDFHNLTYMLKLWLEGLKRYDDKDYIKIDLKINLKDIREVLEEEKYEINDFNIEGCKNLIREGLNSQLQFYSLKDILIDSKDNFSDELIK
jgi:hypothetical protein